MAVVEISSFRTREDHGSAHKADDETRRMALCITLSRCAVRKVMHVVSCFIGAARASMVTLGLRVSVVNVFLLLEVIVVDVNFEECTVCAV